MWDNRLKMKKEHYRTLARSINEVISQNGIPKIKQFRKEVKFVNDQFTSFVWAMWRVSTDQEFRSELYTYLNDSHVETALKSILEAYKN